MSSEDVHVLGQGEKKRMTPQFENVFPICARCREPVYGGDGVTEDGSLFHFVCPKKEKAELARANETRAHFDQMSAVEAVRLQAVHARDRANWQGNPQFWRKQKERMS